MKSFLVYISLTVFLGNLNAQINSFCGTDELLKIYFNNNSKAKIDYLHRQQLLKSEDSTSFLNGYQKKLMTTTTYTIPVVFHILHLYGTENISDAQIIDEINILNRDYRKLNSDTSNIFPPFTAADVNFEFRLATKDTNGNCTTGITRHVDANTNWAYPASSSQYAYTWNSTKYLNIYVAKSITGFAYGGYSSFPGTNAWPSDVIVVTSDCIGSIGTSNNVKSRILTHEVGHFFNLEHTWGNNTFGVTCGDDGVSDTPITKGWSTCPTASSLTAICNPTITENFQNYMDYAHGCSYMFTAGQASRMNSAINSTVSGRSNLWTNSNLISTGVLYPQSPCMPIPDFYSTTGYTICSGQNLTFKDASFNGPVSNWNWSVTGGTITSPSSSITSIYFSSVGTQTVTLTVGNTLGNSTTTKTVIVINGIANYTNSYQESFESFGLPSNWNILNPGGGTTWQQISGAASTGTNSFYINGALDPAGDIDILETPSYDFSNNPGAIFSFKYAYARYSALNSDTFKVAVSSDCGSNWTNINIGSNSILSSGSGGTTSIPFIPTTSQFKTYTLTSHPAFNPFKSQSNVKIRFYFKEDFNSGFGNNLYLDDVNFDVPLSVYNQNSSIKFNLFPNPSNSTVNMDFILATDSKINWQITDILGRSVENMDDIEMKPGFHRIIINQSNEVKPGIYIVSFVINSQKIVTKLIIE